MLLVALSVGVLLNITFTSSFILALTVGDRKGRAFYILGIYSIYNLAMSLSYLYKVLGGVL